MASLKTELPLSLALLGNLSNVICIKAGRLLRKSGDCTWASIFVCGKHSVTL